MRFACLVDERAGQGGEELGQQHALLQLCLGRLARLRFDDVPVHLDLDVDDGDVARADLALDGRDLRHRLAHVLEASLEHLLGDLVRVVRRLDRKRGDVGKRHLRHDADGRLQLGGPSALQLDDLHVRVVDGVDRLVVECLTHDLGHHRLDDLFAQRCRPDASLDQGARRLARSKTFDLGPRGETVEHSIVVRVDDVGRHLDRHPDLALGQALGHD